MPQAGSTLLCTPRTGEPQGTSQYYEFPSTTKDCKGAAAAASHADLHHNSNMVSGKLPNLNHVMTPEVVGAGPRQPSLSSPTNYILGAMSGPQHHGDGSSTRRELEQLIHPLPQRPMPYRHKPPADSIEMKRREICRNFLANRCKRGDTCHRKHILEGDDIRNVSASFPTNLGHVVPTTIPISPPPANTAMPMASPMIASSIRIVDGLYTDRFSRQHALGLDGPSTALPSLPPINKQSEELLHGPLSHAHLVASPSQSLQDEGRHDPLLALRQASPLPPSPQLQLPPPPSTRPLSSTTDGGAVSSSSVRYPARAMEEDTRPSRRSNEVCRLYQTGQCPYGDCCFRTHTLALPIQVTALASASGMGKVKKPAPAPLPTHIGGVELCKLNLAGKCPRGDSCHYSHDFELPPSPEPSKTMETAPGMAVPAQDAGPSTEKPPSPPPPARLPPAAAHPPASEPPRKVYVKLPGDVCRMYFFKRQCAWPSCRYRHCSPEEMQAIRELSHAMAEAEKEVAVAVDLPVPAEQDDPVPEEADDEHEGEHLRPSEHASVEEDGSVGESSSRPSNTSKKRIKSRKKKGKDREAVDELVHDDGKDKAVVVKEDTNVAEGVKLKEDKGKAKAKDGVNNEKKNVKEKNRATRDQNADEGCKPSSGSKTPGASVKDGKGKEKDEKSTDKEKSKEKEKSEKEKEKSKEKEPGRGRAKGRSSVEVAAPRTEPSALQSSPSLVGSNTPEKSRITPQLPIVGPLPSSQRASAPHAKAAGTSKHTTGLQMQELPDDGGDTDVEESDSSYYTPGSGTVSAQTSWSSMDGRSSVSTVKVAYCFDFIRGNCRRQYCRFSHDVPNSFLGSARSVHQGSLSGSSNLNVEHDREVPSGSRSAVGRGSRMPPDLVNDPHTPAFRTIHTSDRLTRQVLEGSSTDPVIPPGLGLDTADVANAGQLRQGQGADEAVTITVLDSTKVTFGSGFRVVQVGTGFESRQILLEKLPTTVVPADLKSALSSFGDVTTVLAVESDEDGWSAYRVSFSRADCAIDAAEALNGSELFGSTVAAQVTARKSTGIGGGRLHDGDVLFELPTARQKGYVGYETLEKAEKAIALATQRGMKGMRVTGKIYEGIPVVGTINVRFENLPADATAKDLARYGAFETHMVDRPKYEWTVNVAVDGLRRMLETHGEVSLNVLPPPYGKIFRVWAHFKDPHAAASAYEALNLFCPRFVGKQRIFAHHVRSIRYNLPADIYHILAYDINLLRSYHYDEHATSISVFDRRTTVAPKAPVFIKLVSRNMSSLTKLKVAFDRLLRGEKVTAEGQIVWNDFFGGHAGKEFLDELEKVHPTVRINRDPRRRTLALFGPQQDRAPVSAEIIARAKLLQAQRKHRYTIAGNVIGVFMSEDLAALQKDLGHENVWIDITHKQLVVCGDADTQKVARLAVQHAGKRCKKRNSRGEVGCPVCLGEVSQPVTLLCGHTWCRACLTGYMNASVDNKTFPLTCLGDDAKCSHHIPLSIAQQFLSPDEFDAVVNASFLAYVQSRPSEFHYCPTPDCAQVYRKSRRDTVLQCPSCLVRICAHCDMEYHESRSCQDRNPEDEKLFETWKTGHDVKDCPSCKVPIERMAGCNHMTCTSCHTHICWACLATFETSGDVYNHMRTIHGGIGL